MTPHPPGKPRPQEIQGDPARLSEAIANTDKAQAEYDQALHALMADSSDSLAKTKVRAAERQVTNARTQLANVMAAKREAETAAPATHRQRATPKAVRDAPGFDLRPDPLTANTASELLEALRLFRVWAGEPTYREMASRAAGRAAPSTMCTALGSRYLSLPPLKVVLAVVIGCGGNEDDQRDFTTAWRRIRLFEEGVWSALEPRPELRVLSPATGTG
jgi:hypothetical protein